MNGISFQLYDIMKYFTFKCARIYTNEKKETQIHWTNISTNISKRRKKCSMILWYSHFNYMHFFFSQAYSHSLAVSFSLSSEIFKCIFIHVFMFLIPCIWLLLILFFCKALPVLFFFFLLFYAYFFLWLAIVGVGMMWIGVGVFVICIYLHASFFWATIKLL